MPQHYFNEIDSGISGGDAPPEVPGGFGQGAVPNALAKLFGMGNNNAASRIQRDPAFTENPNFPEQHYSAGMDLMGDGPETREYEQGTLAPATGQSFDEAFAAGRAKQMAANPSDPGGGTFTWDGKSFHTGIAGEGATKAAPTDTTNAAVGTHPPPYDIEASNEVATAAPAASPPEATEAVIAAPPISTEVVPKAPKAGAVIAPPESATSTTPPVVAATEEGMPDLPNSYLGNVGNVVGGGLDSLIDAITYSLVGTQNFLTKGVSVPSPERDAEIAERDKYQAEFAKGSEGRLGDAYDYESSRHPLIASIIERIKREWADRNQYATPTASASIPPPVAPTTGGTQRTFSPTD